MCLGLGWPLGLEVSRTAPMYRAAILKHKEIAWGWVCAFLIGSFAGLVFLGKAAPQVGLNCFLEKGGLSAHFAIADLDGDQRPDLATVQVDRYNARTTGYSIHLQFAGGAESSISITAPLGGLQISARDVNGDDFTDLVVMTALDSLPVAVLVNDGHGNFKVVMPETFSSPGSEAHGRLDSPAVYFADTTLLLQSRCTFGTEGDFRSDACPPVVLARVRFRDQEIAIRPILRSLTGRSPPVTALFT
jgi:hypothetical protein